MQQAISGGSRDTEVKEFTVSPTGRSATMPVTTVTPVAKWPRTSRNAVESDGSARRSPGPAAPLTR